MKELDAKQRECGVIKNEEQLLIQRKVFEQRRQFTRNVVMREIKKHYLLCSS